jgi:MFS family permease
MPAANPARPFPRFVYGPLIASIRTLLTSRPLVFAVVGIAFFTFLVAYMRQVVYMHGQSQQPPWSEAYTSVVVGTVALGIGIGSPLAGWLSGGKVEVGLVPIGALGMVLATSVAAFSLFFVPVLVACIVAIGFFTGFYLVPLYSLLQHRAPKMSKGDSIATSNFINITGALAATVVFFSLNAAAERSGFAPALSPVEADVVGILDEKPVNEHGRPVLLVIDGKQILGTHEPDRIESLLTGETVAQEKQHVILRVDKDVKVGEPVVLRTYRQGHVTYRLLQPTYEAPNPIYNKEKVPELLFLGTGATTLLTLALLWYFLPDLFRRTWLWLRGLGRYRLELAGMLRLPGNGPVAIVTDASGREALEHVERAADRMIHLGKTVEEARRVLGRGHVLAVALADAAGPLAEYLAGDRTAPVLPVHHAETTRHGKRVVCVVAGNLLPPGAPAETIRAELRRVSEETSRRLAGGLPLETEAAH